MYRVLAEAHEVRELRAQARHPVDTKPELVATGPNRLVLGHHQLKGPIPYLYYSLYSDPRPLQPLRRGLARHENARERLIANLPETGHRPAAPTRRAHESKLVALPSRT